MYNKKKIIILPFICSYIILLGIILSQYIHIRKLESDTEIDGKIIIFFLLYIL